MVGIGLGGHLVSAAKSVEVVDVKRAEVNLKRLEHIRQADTLTFRLRTVDNHIKLRRIDVQAGHQTGDLSRFGGFHHQEPRVLNQRLKPHAAAIFHLHLESAGGAETGDGRWRKYAEETIGNVGELRLQPTRYG